MSSILEFLLFKFSTLETVWSVVDISESVLTVELPLSLITPCVKELLIRLYQDSIARKSLVPCNATLNFCHTEQ